MFSGIAHRIALPHVGLNDISRFWELRFAVWHCLPAAGTRFARGKQALAGSGTSLPGQFQNGEGVRHVPFASCAT